MHFLYLGVKLPNLKLKTRPKQILSSLMLNIVLPRLLYNRCPGYLQQKIFQLLKLFIKQLISCPYHFIFCIHSSVCHLCFDILKRINYCSSYCVAKSVQLYLNFSTQLNHPIQFLWKAKQLKDDNTQRLVLKCCSDHDIDQNCNKLTNDACI